MSDFRFSNLYAIVFLLLFFVCIKNRGYERGSFSRVDKYPKLRKNQALPRFHTLLFPHVNNGNALSPFDTIDTAQQVIASGKCQEINCSDREL